jgi:SpoVK/Ycf46/Vps4 family AAA+-type ATPase
MVTCGDLGTEPVELERKLSGSFQVATDWRAVLLLDEADVFLQERDVNDLQRNALVSIFLRHLEYYDGLLFLTTNRPGQLDEAFQSRIHITFGLPELDFSQQKKVWLLFLKRLILDKDKRRNYEKLKELYSWISDELQQVLIDANYSMNGQQIRNCIRSANAIAHKDGRSLQKDDLLTVIKLGQDFTRYMEKVKRMNTHDKARSLGYRMLGA